MPTAASLATVKCLQDPVCQARLGTKIMVPGQNNYPVTLLALSSDMQATPDGFRVNLRIVVANNEGHDFGPFEMVVSPAVLRQGQPILPPPVILVRVERLGAGETGVFYADAVLLPAPEGGKFHCLDRDFKPQA